MLKIKLNFKNNAKITEENLKVGMRVRIKRGYHYNSAGGEEPPKEKWVIGTISKVDWYFSVKTKNGVEYGYSLSAGRNGRDYNEIFLMSE